MEGLATPGKVIYGPDLSLESQAPDLRNLDTNGHGTFMAGLIAGKDAGLSAPYSDAPASAYRGMAPDARIVSVKVGVADGGVDVSQVIAAIDWVVQHRNDNDLNIRVINLSYGTNSAQPSTIDPLAYAAEQAWKAGIFVVAAGGNYGFQSHMNNAPALADPAIDRYLMAVGSSDSEGTMTIADDSVPAFSPWPKRGATRGVDLIAPGTHLQGLRVPNSYNDLNHPEGQIGSRFFRGSGTSESAALVSGAAALLYQMYPNAKPDQDQEAADQRRRRHQRQGAGDRRWRAAAPADPHDRACRPRSRRGPSPPGIGTPGGRPRPRSPDQRRRRPDRRAGHLRPAASTRSSMAALEADHSSWSGGTWNGNSWSGSSGRATAGRGSSLVRQLMVRQQLVRQQLVGQLVVRQQLVRQLVVGQQLVGQLLVGQQLVDRELGLARPRLRAGRRPGRTLRGDG